MSLVVHIHILEAIGLGGLESRLEAIRCLDSTVQHILAIPSGWRSSVPIYWGGQVIELPTNPNLLGDYKGLVIFHEFLSSILDRYPRSVIHTHTPWPAIAVASAPCMARSVHAHTLHGPMWIPWLGKGKGVFHDVITNLVDRTITVSGEVRARASSAGVFRRLLTISNASATERSRVTTKRVPGISGVKAAFASRLDVGKCEGLYELLDLLRDCRERIHLDIFGDGPLLHEISKRVEEVGNQVRVMGADHSFKTRIPDYDLIIGEGRVVLEALSAVKPVLVCGSKLAGFVTFENIDALEYSNCTSRGLSDVKPPTLGELLDPPAPPPLPAGLPISELNAYLAIRSNRAVVARQRFAVNFKNVILCTERERMNVIDIIDELEQESDDGCALRPDQYSRLSDRGMFG